MFRAITIAAVALVLAGCAVWWKLARRPAKKGSVPAGRFPRLERLVAAAVWISFIVLAFTGFLGATIPGRSLAGFWTLTHVTFSALFAGSLAILLVMRAEACSFADTCQAGRFSLAQKICFWTIAACGILLILSIVTAMFPVLGTDGQYISTEVHRYSALVALLAAIVYACLALKRKV